REGLGLRLFSWPPGTAGELHSRPTRRDVRVPSRVAPESAELPDLTTARLWSTNTVRRSCFQADGRPGRELAWAGFHRTSKPLEPAWLPGDNCRPGNRPWL